MQVTKLVFLLLVLGLAFQVSAETYLTKKEFINLVVQKDSQPETKTLWLDKALQKEIKAILDHKYPKLRLKYWQNQNQTIWFLEEI